MQVLGCLFFFILGVVLFVLVGALSLIMRILSAFGVQVPWFKFFKSGIVPQDTSVHTSAEQKIEKKKVFTEDDGEYVDFEEVKD